MVNSGEVQLGLAMNNIADDAWFGRGAWEGKPAENFRAIGVVYPEVYQGVALKNSGIKSIADIAGKSSSWTCRKWYSCIKRSCIC